MDGNVGRREGRCLRDLLERNAQDIKSGAGQYFTPRPLIQAIVDCIAPRSGEVIIDPACGTGGFLLLAHNHLASHYDLDKEGETDKTTVTYNRPDFWRTTSNKQLNVVQHVKSLLTVHARAAIVVPDNVLFEGGAGETVRRKLLHECDVHTLLRLPTGCSTPGGEGEHACCSSTASPERSSHGRRPWVYDLRTNKHFTSRPTV